MDSSLPDSCFESDESIEERLRKLLESEMDEQLEK
jgi:hypothetical protein